MLESLGEPHCWIAPGRDTANDYYGYIDAKCCQDGELSRPLWPLESIATALAEAEARGRRQGLEEAAGICRKYGSEVGDAGILARALAARFRSLATTPAETQKPETGESLNRLLASAEPTVSRQGNLLMLDCPDGTITDEIFNVLEAACYSSPNRSSLAALEGGEQP